MRVLYLSYTGLLEPLGQSQVYAYLKRLARQHEITLITFEKPADLADGAKVAGQEAVCARDRIRWLHKRYHHRPRLLATGWDLTVFLTAALRNAAGGKADLIHARSYIPAYVALAVKRLLGVPFIFDMRALWPEEMVAAGRLHHGSAMHRLLKAGERACLRQAVAVVSLTEAGVRHIRKTDDPAISGADFVVIPTCVDLDRFVPHPGSSGGKVAERRIGSVGTILSGWFRMDWLMAFFRAALAADPMLELHIVTRDDAASVISAVEKAGLASERVALYSRSPPDVAASLATFDAGVMFFETGIAKIGSCPTRLGETLACGIPVVTNRGVGDVAEIVTQYRVGALVEDGSEKAMRYAWAELTELLQDPNLRARCRHAAEHYFSLDRGVSLYNDLYLRVGSSAKPASVRV